MLLQLKKLMRKRPKSQRVRKLIKLPRRRLMLQQLRRRDIIPRKAVISMSKPMSTKRISRRRKHMVATMLVQWKTSDMPKMMHFQHLLTVRPLPRKSVEPLSPLNLTIVIMAPESKTKRISPTSLPVWKELKLSWIRPPRNSYERSLWENGPEFSPNTCT